MNKSSDIKLNTYYKIDLICNNGVKLFSDSADYKKFFTILEKYLLLNNDIGIMAYCLNPSGIHLMCCAESKKSLNSFIKNICHHYDKYFFNMYYVLDVLNDNEFKIVEISDDAIMQISKNIHTTPEDWADYEFSSLRAYLYNDSPAWLSKDIIENLSKTTMNYYNYITN